MPHSEAQAWWADVQHVRESIERRRAGGAGSSAPLDAPTERRFVRAAAESLPPLDDFDWTSTIPGDSSDRFIHMDAAARTAPASRAPRIDDRDADEHVDIDAELAALQTERPARRSGPENRRESGNRRVSGDRREGEDRRATRPRESATAPAAGIALQPPPARRTVQITGRPGAAPPLARLVEVERRRPPRRPAERVGPRPDRIALWAVLLGFFLILVAATSSNAATHPAHAADHAAVALHVPAR
jgi:hypothetical protein